VPFEVRVFLNCLPMFGKKVSAIYFSGSDILACELDSSRDTLTRAASLKLPEGIILSDRVVDSKKLSEIIADFWRRNSFKSKDVVIVIPEFTTFTKLISLPKISLGEVDQAVIWQAQEYLPQSIEDMTIDWKILSKTDSSLDVLVVATYKNTLMGYVDAVSGAGLYPLAVGIPSASISNIVLSDSPYIVVFAESDQLLVVAGEKGKIFATSITRVVDTGEAVLTVERVLKHFSNIRFGKIFVGGEKMNSQFIQQIKDAHRLDISILDPQINADHSLVQKFLVPISALRQKIATPSDPTTLNLLPAGIVEKYQKLELRTQIWSLILTVSVFVWVSLLVALGSFLILNQQIAKLKSSSEFALNSESNAKTLESDIAKINKVAKDVLQIKNSTVFPSVIWNKIFALLPVGVGISSYEFDLDRGVIVLRGVSSTRESLVAFKEALEDVKEFGGVDIPISSFEDVSNLEFVATFTYLPLKTKNQPEAVKQ